MQKLKRTQHNTHKKAQRKPHTKHTHIVDPNLGLGRGLHEGAVVELPGEVEALVLAHDALLLEVALVAHQHHGDVVSILKKERAKNEVKLDVFRSSFRGPN